jgi:hypothetical protein
MDAQNLSALREQNTPTVVIDRHIEGWDVDTVCADSVAGAYALVKHLINLGHRQIAMITGPANTSTSKDRVTGYLLALRESGIEKDEHFIRYGEYRVNVGMALTDQMFDQGLRPTAIFAANNLVAMGALEALQKRNLNVPQDVALVSFDDLPDLIHIFPFLTVVVQSAYEMGTNAAQLLLSRINANYPIQPRHVVLPTRLILRYSCGRLLNNKEIEPIEIKIPNFPTEVILIKPISLDTSGISTPFSRRDDRNTNLEKSDINRLLKVLRHQKVDRLPHLESHITSKRIFEYVLERKINPTLEENKTEGVIISPENYVEFAQRIGMDAIPCQIYWRPPSRSIKKAEDIPNIVHSSPPSHLAERLNYLESCIRAAQGSGVGVFITFSSFFDTALHVAGFSSLDGMNQNQFSLLEKIMDMFLTHQEKVLQSICDRFAYDMAFIMIDDNLLGKGIVNDKFDFLEQNIFPRMQRLITPAKEHDIFVGLHTSGKIDSALPMLHHIGFNMVQLVDPNENNLFFTYQNWHDKMSFIGGFPQKLLENGTKEQVESKVVEFCSKFGERGGYVLGSSNDINDDVLPENFITMIRTIHELYHKNTII